jgi:chromosomal replication initiation ATPase DnaA
MGMHEPIDLSEESPSCLRMRRLVQVLRDDNKRLSEQNRDLRVKLLHYESLDAINSTTSRITVDVIQKLVADHFLLAVSHMTSVARPNHIAHPRQVAMMLCRTFTKLSLEQIGTAFGGRDHGTVIHACRNVENLRTQDSGFNEAVETITTKLVALANAGTKIPE